MNIYSNATPKEIRDEIGSRDSLDVDFLAGAVMVLCRRVSELEAELKKKANAHPAD